MSSVSAPLNPVDYPHPKRGARLWFLCEYVNHHAKKRIYSDREIADFRNWESAIEYPRTVADLPTQDDLEEFTAVRNALRIQAGCF